jgi:hypothetical protein
MMRTRHRQFRRNQSHCSSRRRRRRHHNALSRVVVRGEAGVFEIPSPILSSLDLPSPRQATRNNDPTKLAVVSWWCRAALRTSVRSGCCDGLICVVRHLVQERIAIFVISLGQSREEFQSRRVGTHDLFSFRHAFSQSRLALIFEFIAPLFRVATSHTAPVLLFWIILCPRLQNVFWRRPLRALCARSRWWRRWTTTRWKRCSRK